MTSSIAVSMFTANPVAADICATVLSGGIVLSILRLWEETAKREVFDQKLNRKLVHVSVGLVFMLCWPLFSSGNQGAILAALIPGVNIINMLLVGLGIWKDEATVKSMSRFGDHRELLTGPLYYASAITLVCAIYWRTSPIAIAAVCNLCAGDGLADIVGRRFGHRKLPYNSNKSIAGSIAMATAGFVSSVIYMHYFSSFGYMRESWEMVLGFLMVSLAAALVESLPISTDLDDNLTVPITSILLFWQVTARFILHGVRTTLLLNGLRAFFVRIVTTGTLATRNNEGEKKNKYKENRKGNYKSDHHDLAVQSILCVVGEEKLIFLIPTILWSHSRRDWLL